MNRVFKTVAVVLITVSLVFAGACSERHSRQSTPDVGEGVTYVPDALYITQLQAFSWEPESYNGKKYAVDGMYGVFDGVSCVYRYCSVTDAAGNESVSVVSLALISDGGVRFEAQDGDWIRVVGTINAIAQDGGDADVALSAETFEVLDERGSEYVY